MAQARMRFEWGQTASVIAAVLNAAKGKGKMFQPKDFMPFKDEDNKPMPPERKAMYREAFNSLGRK